METAMAIALLLKTAMELIQDANELSEQAAGGKTTFTPEEFEQVKQKRRDAVERFENA